ncbi:Aldose sugar dehydrogenase YliI [Paenibacillus plantiphilus]|uniref:Aldose sugar dehydrogenase YliI n=1 Tax=Paenibacillus plantiphilus TaxID=2905650 RepID=A0ABN8GSL8_9BACL|nr:PQQ-dependent sugar dehydrogenase [Paenibacillus plantiphilus]CAH1212697.1 Aldose sugar dehydrogenase YliI [Paenibacillus plantiphilus]
MSRRATILFLLMIVGLIVTGCMRSSEKAGGHNDAGLTSADIPYTVDVIASELDVPWEMDIAPDGRIFFTERSGALRVIEDGQLNPEPVITLDSPFISDGEGGLLGLALDPDFSANHYLYLYHTYEEDDEVKNRVLRLIESSNKAQVDKVLIDDLPGSSNHNGGRIKIGPDGHLYMTSGDRYEPTIAQDLGSTGGKILRISLDGTIPSDNPFPNSPVYSWGHRNPQGLAWHPATGELYSAEHGQSAHDEINLIKSGGNYGWPLIEGDESIEDKDTPLLAPLLHSGSNTWAPSGITFVTDGPWQGDLLVAALRGQQLIHVTLEETASSVHSVFYEEFGRLRNIYNGADGTLYLMTNNRDGRGSPSQEDDRIIRLTPKQ